MLRSGALRDAVTAFEVYAEKCIMEFLTRIRYTTPGGKVVRLAPATGHNHLSPSWDTLCKIHKVLGSTIETSEVTYVRTLRHLLARQRGELRTEELRNRYGREAIEEDWLVGDARVKGDVPLAHKRVIEMMDDLASVAHESDRIIYAYIYGGAELPSSFHRLVRSEQNSKGLLIERTV